MDTHRNAKTTPKMRQVIIERSQQGWTPRQIADALAISVRTVAKWVSRGRRSSPLTDASS
ncbi:MAG: sigma-70 family RNA polymerase sigma factor [Acidimicrobiia bacterium]|nr:sigma-70 family RNA polymerase sigma factor [Acidimicrobiia bacterium]